MTGPQGNPSRIRHASVTDFNRHKRRNSKEISLSFLNPSRCHAHPHARCVCVELADAQKELGRPPPRALRVRAYKGAATDFRDGFVRLPLLPGPRAPHRPDLLGSSFYGHAVSRKGPNPMKRCDRCRFFHPHPPARSTGEMVFTHNGVYGGGQCRRHSPVRDESHLIAKFPDVPGDFWCGEFIERETRRWPTSRPRGLVRTLYGRR